MVLPLQESKAITIIYNNRALNERSSLLHPRLEYSALHNAETEES